VRPGLLEHPDEALALHMPYLAQATGQPFSSADGKIIYTQLDPFITFENQREWFHNPKSLYYYRNVNGSILNNFIGQGIYKKVTPKVEDVVWCQDIYKEMEALKAESASLLKKISPQQVQNVPEGEEKFRKAKEFYDNYDYFDAKRILADLIAQAGGAR